MLRNADDRDADHPGTRPPGAPVFRKQDHPMRKTRVPREKKDGAREPPVRDKGAEPPAEGGFDR